MDTPSSDQHVAAGQGRPQTRERTLLDSVIAARRWTAQECVREFAATAERLGEPATLSLVQLKRWRRGNLVTLPRPTACRVAEQLFGHRIEDLLRPAVAFAAAASMPVPDRSGAQQVTLPPSRLDPANGGFEGFVEEFEMAAEESSRFVRRAGGTMSTQVLEQLDSDVAWLALEYLRRPPYALFRKLVAVRADVFALIDAHPDPRFLRDLYRVAGRLTALLAHASSDLGQPYAADSHSRTALLCAKYAGDTDLQAYVRWLQSNAAYWQGDYAAAADLADHGLTQAATGNDILRLASQAARAHAAAHRPRECETALGRALGARDNLTDNPKPVGVFAFAPGKAAYYASETRLALGGPDNAHRAVNEATESLTLLGDDPDTTQAAELLAAGRLDLVAAHLALGELDAAADHTRTVLELPAESRTVPIMGRVAGTYRVLGAPPLAGARLAEELREEIAVFTAYPAARDLPQHPTASDTADRP